MRRDPEPTALSEDERRILAMIEADLDLGDSGFGARYRRRLAEGVGRRTLLPIVAIVGGGVLMVVTFTTSLVLATVGAALMGTGAAVGAQRAEVAIRRMAGLLGWSVDPNDRPRRSGLREHPQ
jgi:hypothetical protein